MKLSFFTKTLEELEYKDVQALVDEKIPESYNLDYKSDYPDNLAKLIIAFANAIGGYIIIGVKTIKDTNIPEELIGIDKAEHSTKVTNIALTHSQPKIFPKVKVIPHSINKEKVIAVIKVEESLEPIMYYHANDKDSNKWFIRINDKVEPADFSILKKLFNKDDYVKQMEEMEAESDSNFDNKLYSHLQYYIDQDYGIFTFGMNVFPFSRDNVLIDVASREFEKYLSNIYNSLNKGLIREPYCFSDYIRNFTYMGKYYNANKFSESERLPKQISNIKIFQKGYIIGTIINPAHRRDPHSDNDYTVLNPQFLIYFFILWLKFIKLIYVEARFNGKFKLIIRFGSVFNFLLNLSDIPFNSHINSIKLERIIYTFNLDDIGMVEEILLDLFEEILRYFCDDYKEVDKIMPYFKETIPEFIKIYYLDLKE